MSKFRDKFSKLQDSVPKDENNPHVKKALGAFRARKPRGKTEEAFYRNPAFTMIRVAMPKDMITLTRRYCRMMITMGFPLGGKYPSVSSLIEFLIHRYVIEDEDGIFEQLVEDYKQWKKNKGL